ncbi:MAG: hypothetical protein U0996_04945 [Planctomycetaceae bacterium]
MTRPADEPGEVDLSLIDRETADPCFHRYCFGDFFAGGKPVWIKIIVGAIATPIVLIFRVVSTDGGRASRFLSGPAATAGLLATGALVGAVLGGSLAMKELSMRDLLPGGLSHGHSGLPSAAATFPCCWFGDRSGSLC